MARGAVWTLGLSAALLAGCLHAPVLWSPDGRWLAYTIAVRPGPRVPAPGWLFDTAPDDPATALPSNRRTSGSPRLYRLWTTRVDTGASVLLEESRGPITSPAWAPDGRALAFGRIASEADGRVRFEVVVQDSPDHQRVILSRPHVDLNEKAADLPGLALAWSPDGRYLAVPLFQQTLDLAIIRADNGRVLKVIDGAYLPAWSPDGTKLVFVRGGDHESLDYLDNHFGPTRHLAEIGQTSQHPVWSRDSQSVLVVRQPKRGAEAPTPQADLIRIKVPTGSVESLVAITAEPADHDKTLLGASFSADRDGDTLYFSRDVKDDPTEIAWFGVRNRVLYKKFHPIDSSIRIGALAVSPTEKMLAIRVGAPGYLSPPGIVDLTPDFPTITPIVPDDDSRIEWITTVIDAARGLIRGGLPPAVRGKSTIERATLLPIPGELDIPARQEIQIRLRTLGRVGRPLCDRPADAPEAEPALLAFLDEARLFFDYLRQDYAAAQSSLERFEARVHHPDQRLRLLSLRAQIALGKREFSQASQTIAFLKAVQRSAPRLFEQTPAGPVLTPLPDPGQAWPAFLEDQANEFRRRAESGKNRDNGNPFGNENPDAPEPPGMNALPGGVPFAPAQLQPPQGGRVLELIPEIEPPVDPPAPPRIRRRRVIPPQ